MECLDDGREVTQEECLKCRYVMCRCCGGCVLENMTKEEFDATLTEVKDFIRED